ncbi:MAG: hypothetical protein P8X57_06605 [Cyclobacteriaceae bacterium]
MARRIFQETQRMRETVSAYVLGAGFLLFLAGLIILIVMERPDRNELITAVAIITTVMFLVGWLMLTLKLEVKIEENRISYRMPPLINREQFIQRSEIEEYEVVDYKPVAHYGGWGLRYSPRHGKALTIAGSNGLALSLTSGKKLLLGTRMKAEIDQAMRRMMENEEDYG